jgi:hypothetical protein
MASTVDIIKSGVAQAAAGKPLDSNTINSEGSSSESTGVSIIGDDEYLRAENSTTEELLSGSEDAPADSQKDTDSEASPSEAKSDAKSETPVSKEVITITDDKGRRKVEVDWSDRDQLKKMVQMAYGARKWQAERDAAISRHKEVESKLSEQQSNWDVMNKVYGERGVEGLVDLLEGRQGAYKESVKRELERAKFLEKASPEEIEALEAREEAQKNAKEIARIRKENEDFKKQMTEKEERAELASLESKVHPVFDKYRFADKLGDADDEHMFDEMLWSSALKRLEPYEDKGLEITPELVDREFRSVASSIRKRIGLQAEKKASKVIQQKKKEATENVQATVRNGYKQGGASKEARDLINSGNLTGLLKGWGKYGSLFQTKK